MRCRAGTNVAEGGCVGIINVGLPLSDTPSRRARSVSTLEDKMTAYLVEIIENGASVTRVTVAAKSPVMAAAKATGRKVCEAPRGTALVRVTPPAGAPTEFGYETVSYVSRPLH
jgi:hypothetical protein